MGKQIGRSPGGGRDTISAFSGSGAIAKVVLRFLDVAPLRSEVAIVEAVERHTELRDELEGGVESVLAAVIGSWSADQGSFRVGDPKGSTPVPQKECQ